MDAEMINGLLDQLRRDSAAELPVTSAAAIAVTRSNGPFPTPTSPVIVGHASQLANVRDFLTDHACGVSVVVVRQDDGSAKGFLNVCRHRGVRVIADQAGNRRSFSCPYHGWTYGADGCLRGIPYRQAFDAIHRDERGLREVPVEIRHGLVWAIPVAGRTIDVEAFLGDALDHELSGTGLARLHVELVDTGFAAEDVTTVRARLQQALRPADDSMRVMYRAVGPHRSALTADVTRLPDSGPRVVDELPDGVSLTYDISDADTVAWHGAHAEVWSIHPALYATQRTTVRGILLVSPEASEESVTSARAAFTRRLATAAPQPAAQEDALRTAAG
jgi:nitrite reductase/ring-hydroxylating ferredoxin subunit